MELLADKEQVKRLIPYAVCGILGIAGVVLLFIGFFVYHPSVSSSDIVFESANESKTENPQSHIMIDVQGAVTRPGVYTLPESSRIQDALIAAGGLSENAHRVYVAKEINLAAHLVDGTKLYIPSQTEVLEASTGKTSSNNQNSSININTATGQQLDSLTGVGAVTVEKIISNRPYSKAEDLVTKKVVGASTFEKIKDMIRVY